MRRFLYCVFIVVIVAGMSALLCNADTLPDPEIIGTSPAPPVVAATVVSVYDGDTLTVRVDDLPTWLGQTIPVRVRGIDTPEMRDKRPEVRALARKAKDVALNLCPPGMEVALTGIKRGKYFRLVAFVNCDGRDLSQALLDQKLAHTYDGGKKEPWQ